MRKLLTCVMFAAIFLFLLPDRTDACSCLKSYSVRKEYQSADAVFIASVTNIEKPTSADPAKVIYYAGRVFLKVEESFKEMTETDVIFPQGGGGDCLPVFAEGERWLIYAGRDKQTGKLYPLGCSRSASLRYASADLLYLRALPEIAEKTRLSGTVDLNDSVPGLSFHFAGHLPNIKITISAAKGKQYVTYTNADGVYEFIGLPPGKYKVHADLPSHLKVSTYSQNDVVITLAERGCDEVNIRAVPIASISGIVLDADGKAVPHLVLNLIYADKAGENLTRKNTQWTFTNDHGQFEFNELSPGSYVFGVNLDREPLGEAPFVRTFYPGVSNPSESQIITLMDGDKITNLIMRLPKRLATRVIEGVLVYSDGRRVIYGGISLRETEENDSPTYHAATQVREGRFSLQVVQGTVGWIHTYASANPAGLGQGGVFGKPFRIEVNDDIKDLKIIIPLPDEK